MILFSRPGKTSQQAPGHLGGMETIMGARALRAEDLGSAPAFGLAAKRIREGDRKPRKRARKRRACPDTAELVERAQHDDTQAFSVLWERHAPTVHAVLLTMVSETEADDLTQEVAVSALCALSTLRKPRSFAAWVCTIARNLGRNVLHAKRHSRIAPIEEASEVAAPPSGDPNTTAEILAHIRALPECHREPLMLRLLLEMTGPEIAKRTGLTEGSVRVNLCRGMKLLRERLRDWEERPS